MIKKTDIFNWHNTNEFQDQFNLKINDQLHFLYSDPYADFKAALIKDEDIIGTKRNLPCDPNRLELLKTQLGEKKQADEILLEIRKDYGHFRG
jgi:hypothetical protein